MRVVTAESRELQRVLRGGEPGSTKRRNAFGVLIDEPAAVAPSVTLFPMDLADLSSVGGCVAAMDAADLRAALLVNNAGLTSPYDETTAQGYELSAGVNFLGTAHFTLSLIEQGVLAPDQGRSGASATSR